MVRAFAHGAMVVGLILHGGVVDPLSYFSFQPVFHDWCNTPWYVLSCLCVECIVK